MSEDEDECNGSEKTVDSTELRGFPLVNEEKKLVRTFKAGGMPAKAKGAITRDGNKGNANKNVASACIKEFTF